MMYIVDDVFSVLPQPNSPHESAAWEKMWLEINYWFVQDEWQNTNRSKSQE